MDLSKDVSEQAKRDFGKSPLSAVLEPLPCQHIGMPEVAVSNGPKCSK
jgi:hypothetical protein